MRKILLLVIACISLFAVGCGSKKEKSDLDKLLAQKEYIIVDVRTKEEYNISHVKDAINIPYDMIDENIELDKNKNIFVYCKSGNRSKIAYDNLTSLGYTVYDLGAFESIDLPKE